MSPLGDNHVEITAGTGAAPFAPPGSLLPSKPYLDFNAIAEQLSSIAPDAQQLVKTLSDRAMDLKTTVERVDDLLNPQNRANLGATLMALGLATEVRTPTSRAWWDHSDARVPAPSMQERGSL